MKTYLMNFNTFINESKLWENDFDELDEQTINELRYMHDLFKSGETTNETEMYQDNLLEFFMVQLESIDENTYFDEIFEDDAEDLKGDIEYRKMTKMGDKSFLKKAASFISWAAFPIKAPYELIKLISKKMKIKKMLKDIPDGAKKEGLRAELNDLSLQQVKAVAALKKARVARKWTTKYGDELGGLAPVKDSEEMEKFSNMLNVFEKAGKISSEQKEKIMNQAKDAGKNQGKGQAQQAKKLASEIADKDPKDRKKEIESMEKEIEDKKKAWAEVQKKAKEAGISLS